MVVPGHTQPGNVADSETCNSTANAIAQTFEVFASLPMAESLAGVLQAACCEVMLDRPKSFRRARGKGHGARGKGQGPRGKGHAAKFSRAACVRSTWLGANGPGLPTTPGSWKTQTGISTGARSRPSPHVPTAKLSAAHLMQ